VSGLTTEQLKSIVAGAPEGMNIRDGESYGFWTPDIHNLSDISEIVALRESNSHAGLRTLLQKAEGRIAELEEELSALSEALDFEREYIKSKEQGE
jgi:hypothetical protein